LCRHVHVQVRRARALPEDQTAGIKCMVLMQHSHRSSWTYQCQKSCLQGQQVGLSISRAAGKMNAVSVKSSGAWDTAAAG
jgi:hypothetical protein